MLKDNVRICIVGPIPPPLGGMAVQTMKLESLLRAEGIRVNTIPVNYPFPKVLNFMERIKYVRAVARLILYMIVLIRKLKNVDLIHILSNSYLSFFLYTAPAVLVGKYYGCKVIINYRGGQAREFLRNYQRTVLWVIKRADALVVPSEFLYNIFSEYEHVPSVIPNIVDVEQFSVKETKEPDYGDINLLVARNLEEIYNIPCAIRAFQYIQKKYPRATLMILGEGKEESNLKKLVADLGLKNVVFAGRIENKDLPDYYKKSTVALNPSNADNFPISVLEAFASGVPVVSTNVGGVPFMIQNELTGLLVNRNDNKAMAGCVARLLDDKDLYHKISENGQKQSLQYVWENIRPKLFAIYHRALDEVSEFS